MYISIISKTHGIGQSKNIECLFYVRIAVFMLGCLYGGLKSVTDISSPIRILEK